MAAPEIAHWKVVAWLAPGPGVYLEPGAIVAQPGDIIPADLEKPETDVHRWAVGYVRSGRICKITPELAEKLGLEQGAAEASGPHKPAAVGSTPTPATTPADPARPETVPAPSPGASPASSKPRRRKGARKA